MLVDLSGYEDLTRPAVAHYWATLQAQSARQREGDADRGGRAAVTGGKQMDGSDGKSHGVVLTKPHIVELILDLIGYTPDRPLHTLRLLEPSCGHGAFVVEAARRLLRSARTNGTDPRFLTSAITAYEVDPASAERSAEAVVEVLVDDGISLAHAKDLAAAWIRTGDFLLAEAEQSFDVIVGNPPYIRIEQLPSVLQSAYRNRYRTLFDRADLYVALIERGLQLLAEAGTLSFICADRWTRNKYGGPLRGLITSRYKLRLYIDLHQASPFDSKVIAYPSIFVIQQAKTSAPVRVATLKTADTKECNLLRLSLRKKKARTSDLVVEYPEWFKGTEPWVITPPEHLRTLKRLEAAFRPLEEFAKVGIGVASGCDRVYLVNEGVDVEPDRLVPIVMRSDIANGKIKDAGRFIINHSATAEKLLA